MKEVNNNEVKEEVKAESKLSYDDLENLARQLSEQNRQMYSHIQEINDQIIFKRLEYLFRVVENHKCFSEKFVENTILEIEKALTLPEIEEEDDEGDN